MSGISEIVKPLAKFFIRALYNQVKQLSEQFGQGFDSAEFESGIQNAINSDDKAHKVLGNSFKSV